MPDEPDSKTVYEEVGRNYRTFLNWRERIVGGYVTIVGFLGWSYRNAQEKEDRALLLLAAIIVSLAFRTLNMRNSKFIREAVEAGKALENTDGFYTKMENLKPVGMTHGLAFSLMSSSVVIVCLLGLLRMTPLWELLNHCASVVTIFVGVVALLDRQHFKALLKE
jgi:hypothetical protein